MEWKPILPKILFFIGVLLCLFQIWLPEYYVTGDGPCHVYNAIVLHDMIGMKNVEFYKNFYHVNNFSNANWFSTIVLSLLICIINGLIAEKILLTLYVLLFISGFYLLLNKLNKDTRYFYLSIFVLVFPHVLAKGFYNYSFAVAFWFWMVWGWVCFLQHKNLRTGLVFFMFSGLTYLSNPLPFVIGIITCWSLSLSIVQSTPSFNHKVFFKQIIQDTILLLIILAPLIAMMTLFSIGHVSNNISIQHHYYRIIELITGKYLITLSHHEDYFAFATAIIIITTLIITIWIKLYNRRLNQYDALILSFIAVLLVTVFFPDNYYCTLILVAMRLHLFVWIIALCMICCMLPFQNVKNIIGCILFAIFIGMSVSRIIVMQNASDSVAKYLSVNKYIKPYSVVMPLDFAPGGKDIAGHEIIDRNWIFTHISDYLAIDKPLIILDNYEANMSYYPLLWNEPVNPYLHLNDFEAHPPFGDIIKYTANSGVNIDHILLWCYNDSFNNDWHFKQFKNQIDSNYAMVYKSQSRRCILYNRK